jgi:C-terminal processing protease CtpA/Prc
MSNQDFEIGARGRLKQAEDAIKNRPAGMLLSNFLKTCERRGRLSKRERLRIVEQALVLLEMNYVHLPLKRAMHAIDPIQQLKLLKFRLLEAGEKELSSEMQFHKRMLEIFASTRDLHTMYLLPEPFRGRVAYLPFLIEQYFEKDKNGRRLEKFTVSRVVGEFYKSNPSPGRELLLFQAGVEVLYWNGVPIRRAIEINGEMQAGSNIEARFARGLDNLTIRPLETSLPPVEAWVTITYRTRSGEVLTFNMDWLVYTVDSTGQARVISTNSRKKRAAIDLKKTMINHLKRELYASREVRVRKSLERTLRAETKYVNGREIGYVRVFSFDVPDPEQFVDEFARVITSDAFPQAGLIIDVRGNAGGKIRAAERLLQLFTPRRIKPELFEFINSPLNLEVCRRAPKNWFLSRWVESIAESVVTGATYSSGFPLNSEESCNDIGQIYYGPVVLIIDALSYSATDMFAAGFQDNEIGEVLGTSDNTGAGGANVWWYQDLMNSVGDHSKSPFKPLPRGADILVAVRRSIRVGKNSGRPLEELGITPDHRHYMTRRDVLRKNDDLIKRAADRLRNKPAYSLSVKSIKRGKSVRSVVVSAGSMVSKSDAGKSISRIDVYLDGRPYKSFDARNGSTQSRRIALGRNGTRKSELLVKAYDRTNHLVASRRLVL